MRLFSIPPPTLLAGFLAVLIGYASSAAIIWQAAIVAGATTAQISGWMTALGLAMGVSTLALTLWYRVPVLTAWSTPGAALLVTGLQGLTLNEAIGVFIVTNVLIVLCGITGLFCSSDAHYSALACGGNACRDFITFWFTGVCQSGWSIYVVWQYVAGMAGNQGRCAALCGNCRDDYWDRDRYRAR